MNNNSHPDRCYTLLTSCVISGVIPFLAIVLGFMLTPPEEYNEVMGALIPVCVFGFSGALAAVFSFGATLWILRSARLKPLPTSLRVLIALLISSFACGGAVHCGLQYMLGLTPAIY